MSQLALFEPLTREQWAAFFERVDWVLPYDTAGGTPAGTVFPGFRCPGCGVVEPDGFSMFQNHGLAPYCPDPGATEPVCRATGRRQYRYRPA